MILWPAHIVSANIKVQDAHARLVMQECQGKQQAAYDARSSLLVQRNLQEEVQ